jgi:hypothetical protein
MQYFFIVAFLGIFISLGMALLAMLRKPDGENTPNRKMAQSLSVRIGLSVAVFIMLWIAYGLGWIHPTGIAAGQ